MQELRFSYGDVVAIISLVTSLAAVWRFAKEIRKPRTDLARMVEKHERMLNVRRENIESNRDRNSMALYCLMKMLEPDANIDEIREELIEFLVRGENRSENV